MPLDLDDKASAESIRVALGQFVSAGIKRFPDHPVELLQKISSDLNKSKRELFFDGTDWL